MAGEQEMFGATQAAIQDYRQRMDARSGVRRVLGINPQAAIKHISGGRAYVKFRIPGLAQATMFSDPYLLLKNGAEMKASGRQLIWRNPADAVTKNLCARGVLRPVKTKDLDPKSPFANIDRVKLLTSEGQIEVIRTPKGLGLFEAPSSAELMKEENQFDAGLLPGEHWSAGYIDGLAEQADSFAGDLEQLSQSSLEGRASGGLPGGKAMDEFDQRMEVIG